MRTRDCVTIGLTGDATKVPYKKQNIKTSLLFPHYNTHYSFNNRTLDIYNNYYHVISWVGSDHPFNPLILSDFVVQSHMVVPLSAWYISPTVDNGKIIKTLLYSTRLHTAVNVLSPSAINFMCWVPRPLVHVYLEQESKKTVTWQTYIARYCRYCFVLVPNWSPIFPAVTIIKILSVE